MTNPFYVQDTGDNKTTKDVPSDAGRFGVDMSQERMPNQKDVMQSTGNYWKDAINKQELAKNGVLPKTYEGDDQTRKSAAADFPLPGTKEAKTLGLTTPDYTKEKAEKLQELTARSQSGVNLPIGYMGPRLSPKEQAELTAWSTIRDDANARESLQRSLEQVLLYAKEDQPLVKEMETNPTAGKLSIGDEDPNSREAKLKYGQQLTAEEKEKWKYPLSKNDEIGLIESLRSNPSLQHLEIPEFPASKDKSRFGFYDNRLDKILPRLLPTRKGYPSIR